MYRTSFPKSIRNDNNLLVTLYFLLKIRQVSAVADELCISQSAVSQQLSKLRDIFNDQLLIKGSKKMILTPCAERISKKLQVVIETTEEIYDIINFFAQVKPTKTRYTICTYGGEYNLDIATVIAGILKELSMEGMVSFDLVQRDHNSLDDLMTGRVDFYVGSIVFMPEDISFVELKTHTYSFAVSKQHKLANQHINENELMEFEHVLIVNGEMLNKLYQERFPLLANKKPFLQMQSFYAISSLVQNSDMFSFLPVDIINDFDLAPVHVERKVIQLTSNLYWHQSLDSDSFHKYVRDRVVDVIKNSDRYF